MFKFRSMRANAEERLESRRARNEASGPSWSGAGAPAATEEVP